MKAAHILIVDDDEHVLVTSRMILKNYFEGIETLASPKTLESRLRQGDVDVVLLDMNFQAGVTSGNEGIFWMNKIRQLSPQTQVVLQTAYGDIELAVKSIKEGAVDYLPKPWDKEKLISTMINAYQQTMARKENKDLRTRQKALQEHINQKQVPFIASSPAMKPILQAMEMAAPTEASILILGENGTGKEVLARAIHHHSKRADEPFISVDVGALPATLFESEMFGHEKGAFTDAKEQRVGKFELANKGTLFLDEIGNLLPELQVKILSAIQNKVITPIGSNRRIDLDVRLICATNAPIHELVQRGTFRQDLFYRIKTVELNLPPLRHRKEDISELVKHYLDEFCKRYNKDLKIDSSLVAQLTHYHWPGNIRELQHAIERAVILCRGDSLSIADLQLVPHDGHPSASLKTLNLSEMEKEAIQEAVRSSSGNLTKAAETLGIGRTTLYRKMEEYGLNSG